MQTLLLTERQSSTCRLPNEDLDYLLAHHSRHLKIAPARDGNIVLMPTRLVGLIVGPSMRFVIRPKLPLPSFTHLLGDERSATPDDGTEFELLPFLAERLMQLIAERVAVGLHRGYREQHTEGTLIQGRLDLTATLRETSRRDRLHSTHDEHTIDVVCNQILRATVDRLLSSRLFGEDLQRRLEMTGDQLVGLTPIALTPAVFASVLPPPGYRAVLELCRLIAEGLQPAAGMGQTAQVFLIDLERLFERHVSRGVRTAIADSPFHIEEQRSFHLHDADTGAAAVRLQPDIVIRSTRGVEMVIDAKWKRLKPGRAHPADLYQLLAYGSTLGARQLVLVHPGRRDVVRRLRVADEVTVNLHTLHVTGGSKQCSRSLRRLGHALRGCLDG